MKKFVNKLISSEQNKMRDVAFGPAIYVASAIPVVLIIAVIAIVIFAAVKIVRISRDKKNKTE